MKYFIALTAISFLALMLNGLLTYQTPQISQTVVYGLILSGSLIMLLFVRHFAGKQREWIGWEEDPGSKNVSILYWLLGVSLVFACANGVPSVLIQTGFKAALFVPTPNMQIAMSPVWFMILLDVFFNATVVGFSEQGLQVSAINSLALLTENPVARGLIAVGVIGLVSVAHGFVAYSGPYMWLGIIAAFLSFLVMFGFQIKTKSLVLGGQIHSAYNILEILLPLLLAMIGIHVSSS